MEVEEMKTSEMEVSPACNSQSLTDAEVARHQEETPVPLPVYTEKSELKCEISDSEIRGIIEVIAATGKFWHDWDTLKSLLSRWLKQVLAEYPESQPVASTEIITSSLYDETYQELVKRLDGELLSFVEGPPFTLQRICEIFLSAKQIYPKLSKLVLALDRNLSVTSTISISMNPYPGGQTAENHAVESVLNTGDEHIQNQSSPSQNGIGGVQGDTDVEMVEAEVDEDVPKSDVEMKEEKNIAEISDSTENASVEPSIDSNILTEPCVVNVLIESANSVDAQTPEATQPKS